MAVTLHSHTRKGQVWQRPGQQSMAETDALFARSWMPDCSTLPLLLQCTGAKVKHDIPTGKSLW